MRENILYTCIYQITDIQKQARNYNKTNNQLENGQEICIDKLTKKICSFLNNKKERKRKTYK